MSAVPVGTTAVPPASLALRTTGAEDTRALGAALAGGLVVGDVVLLVGGLGSGKTTLAQGVARGLGVAEVVTSPTFTLLRAYPCGAPGPVHVLLHADLYRLDQLGEVADLGIAELVEDAAVAVVEWGDVAGPTLGQAALTVELAEGEGEDVRRVTVRGAPGAPGRVGALAPFVARWSA
ncbi:MAG TPA: tRNA (adenosine(37)-N6)-threonylcarbamoyltransferase complex ATPase subunit type 1 TsaE [Acidimicrobiales bacterium]|nr:tRNA (adenosine(37)-N6)-threonylcarbamoyltransferase complex ATPase subunit type 1 TsaE [Acidimicrobiales bacterium]